MSSSAVGYAVGDRTDAPTLAVFRLAQLAMVTANLGRIPVFSTGDREAPLTVNELGLGLVVLVAMISGIRRREFRLDGVMLTALAFAALGAGSALWTAQQYGLTALEIAVSLSYLARWVAYAMIYAALRNAIGRDTATSLWSSVEWMLVIIGAFGIVQAAFLPNFAQLVYPESRAVVDWDVQGHRLVSTILEPNIVGTMLMVGVLVQLALISTGAAVSRWKLAVLFVAMCLTLSRSAALGFLVGAMTLLAIRGISRRLARLAFGLALVGLVALPAFVRFAAAYGKFSVGAGTSAGERVLAWLRALVILRDHPIFGVGFNTFAYVAERYGSVRMGAASYGSDGGLLFIAVMTGFVGLTIYCFMLWQVGLRARRVWNSRDETPVARGLAIGTVAATVGVVVSSFFINSLLTTYVMEILWVLWAIAGILAAPRVVAERRSPIRLVPLRV